MDPQAEAELIRKAQSGCRASQDRLAVEHQYRLEMLIDLRMGPRLRSRVEPLDIFQETWLEACLALSTFQIRGDGSFFKWLAAISEHVILDKHRYYFDTHRQLENVSLDQGSSNGSEGPGSWLKDGSAVSPSRAAMRGERFNRLKMALDQLSDDHRRAILLAKIHGLRIADIAKLMGREEGAVSMLLYRGLHKLKEIFGDTSSLHLPPRRLDGLDPGPRRPQA